jgi:hypothetical protein
MNVVNIFDRIVLRYTTFIINISTEKEQKKIKRIPLFNFGMTIIIFRLLPNSDNRKLVKNISK